MRVRLLLPLCIASLLAGYIPIGTAQDEEPAFDEETVEEQIPQDGEEDLPEPLDQEPSPPDQSEEGSEDETRSIVIDVAVTLNYLFENSPDNFIIKYSFHMEGKTAAKTSVVKGDVEVTSEVDGFLAKWPTGECKLEVAIPKVPFQMTFSKTNEEKGKLNIRFQRKFVETWQSVCSFTDAPGKQFDTRGELEQWLAKALEKARPPLSSLALDLDPNEETTTTFTISKQSLKDPPLGAAEIEGTGVITVKSGLAE